MGIAVRNEFCGRQWSGSKGRSLMCQREAGHGGAHVAEVSLDRRILRYWLLPVTGERGMNEYRATEAARTADASAA